MSFRVPVSTPQIVPQSQPSAWQVSAPPQMYSQTPAVVAVPNLSVPPPVFPAPGFPNLPPQQVLPQGSLPPQRPPFTYGPRPPAHGEQPMMSTRPPFQATRPPFRGAPPQSLGNRPPFIGRPPPMAGQTMRQPMPTGPPPMLAGPPSSSQTFSVVPGTSNFPPNSGMPVSQHLATAQPGYNMNVNISTAPTQSVAPSMPYPQVLSNSGFSTSVSVPSYGQQPYVANAVSSVSIPGSQPIVLGSRPPPWQTVQSSVPAMQPNLQPGGFNPPSIMSNLPYPGNSALRIDTKLGPTMITVDKESFIEESDGLSPVSDIEKQTYDPESPGFVRGDKRRLSYTEEEQYKHHRSDYDDRRYDHGERSQEKDSHRRRRSRSLHREEREEHSHNSGSRHSDRSAPKRHERFDNDPCNREMDRSDRHSYDAPLDQDEVANLVQRYTDRSDGYEDIGDTKDENRNSYMAEKHTSHEGYNRRHGERGRNDNSFRGSGDRRYDSRRDDKDQSGECEKEGERYESRDKRYDDNARHGSRNTRTQENRRNESGNRNVDANRNVRSGRDVKYQRDSARGNEREWDFGKSRDRGSQNNLQDSDRRDNRNNRDTELLDRENRVRDVREDDRYGTRGQDCRRGDEDRRSGDRGTFGEYRNRGSYMSNDFPKRKENAVSFLIISSQVGCSSFWYTKFVSILNSLSSMFQLRSKFTVLFYDTTLLPPNN